MTDGGSARANAASGVLRQTGSLPSRSQAGAVGVLAVAAEQLVAPLAGEDDLDVAGRLLRNEIDGHDRRVADRRIEVVDDLFVAVGEVLQRAGQLDVVDVEMRGDGGGVLQFGVARHVEADGERLDARRQLGGDRRDDRRVDAAGKEAAQRHVREHMRRDRVLDRLAQPQLLFGVGALRRCEHRTVVGVDFGMFAVAEHIAALGQDADVAGERVRLRDVLEGQVVLQERGVDLEAVVARIEEIGLHFAGEDIAVRRFAVVERLDAEGVASGHQDAGFAVVEQEGEHPAQAVDERRAVGGVERDDRLDLRAGAEDGPAGNQLVAQLEVVVDLAVVDGEIAAVFS